MPKTHRPNTKLGRLGPPSPPPPAAEKDLPPAISLAMQRVMLRRSGRFEGLCMQERALLCELLRCVPLSAPGEAFQVRNSVLCVRLDWSLATVTRWLKSLRVKGWLDREQSMFKARKNGFAIAESTLSAEAVDELGLAALPSPHPFLRDASVSNAMKGFPKKFSSKRNVDPAEADSTGLLKNPASPNPKLGRGARMPAHLRPMLEVMKDFEVVLLLSLAKRKEVRLEDVWVCREDAIRKARTPMAYMRTLIEQPFDWGYGRKVLSERREEVEKAAKAEGEAKDLKRMLDAAEARLRGRRFIGERGTYLVLGDGCVELETRDGRRWSDRLTEGLVHAIETGRLVEVTRKVDGRRLH